MLLIQRLLMFVEMEKPVLMLEEQYRMHPEIAAFPSSHVYNNFLRSHRFDIVSQFYIEVLCCSLLSFHFWAFTFLSLLSFDPSVSHVANWLTDLFTHERTDGRTKWQGDEDRSLLGPRCDELLMRDSKTSLTDRLTDWQTDFLWMTPCSNGSRKE